MSVFNRNAIGEMVGRVGCGFAILAIVIFILSILW